MPNRFASFSVSIKSRITLSALVGADDRSKITSSKQADAIFSSDSRDSVFKRAK
jgi:hypothetical protein